MPGQDHIAETAEERLERYRRMADSTRELAGRTEDPEIRTAYLELAARWVALAEQAARELPDDTLARALNDPRDEARSA